jgi:mannose-6-phosphate isomerase-like protein (cupin superfamily)
MVHVIRGAQAPEFEVPGVRFTGLAAPSRGSAGLCTWRITVEPGLAQGQPHRLDHDEVFMVTAGRIRVTPGGDLLGPGDAATVPAGQPIAVGNPGDEPAQAYIAIAAGFTATMDDGTEIGTPPWAS